MRHYLVPALVLVLCLAALGVQAEATYLPLICKGQAGVSVTATPTATPTLTPTPTTVANPNLIIAQVVTSTRCESISIANISNMDVPMSGWRIHSVVGDQWYTFLTGFVLQAGAMVRITSGPDSYDDPPDVFRWRDSYVWNNEGDEACLIDPGGEIVASYSY